MSEAGADPMAEEKKQKKERVRNLKVRLHDASAREQLMMIGSKLANAHLSEFPEMSHLFPDLHLDATACRAGLVRFLFSKPLHYFLLILLAMDVLTVVVGLQLKIEVASLEGMAIAECLRLTINETHSDSAHHALNLQTFQSTAEARECVEKSSPHKTSETLESVDHVLGITSISILVIFLIENLCFLVAFRCSYFKIIYFPLDLFVVLVSLFTEIIGMVGHLSVGLDSATELGTAASMMAQGFSPVAALMIIGRFWRFARIGHAVYLLQTSEVNEERLENLQPEIVDGKNTKENCEV